MSKRNIFTIAISAIVVCVIVCAIGYALAIYINPPSKPTVYAELSVALPGTAEIVNDVAGAIKEACGESGSITFRSWNGEWMGTHGDTELELHSIGKAVLTSFGYALETYNGTYSVVAATETDPAKLILDLNEYDWGWPKMTVYRDQSELLLMSLLDSKGMLFQNRAGAKVVQDRVSFWPFRQIPNKADN